MRRVKFSKKDTDTTVVGARVPRSYADSLYHLACKYSEDAGKEISVSTLIRRALDKEYGEIMDGSVEV